MNNQLPLTHPATNPDGTCNDQSCPCQQWSKQAATTDTVSDCEPGTINPYEYLKTFKYPPEQPTPDSPALRRGRSIGQPDVVTLCPDCGYCYYKNKPHTCADWTRGDELNALRNTKSILHHAEMVEERKHVRFLVNLKTGRTIEVSRKRVGELRREGRIVENACVCPSKCDCENPEPKFGTALVSNGWPSAQSIPVNNAGVHG